MGFEMLRSAQHDSIVSHTASLVVTLSRSEGSLSMGLEMLRGVYTERSECAQHDSIVLLSRLCSCSI